MTADICNRDRNGNSTASEAVYASGADARKSPGRAEIAATRSSGWAVSAARAGS